MEVSTSPVKSNVGHRPSIHTINEALEGSRDVVGLIKCVYLRIPAEEPNVARRTLTEVVGLRNILFIVAGVSVTCVAVPDFVINLFRLTNSRSQRERGSISGPQGYTNLDPAVTELF